MTVIQSHTYSINLDNVAYFSSDEHDQTRFTMNNGLSVRITCPYDEVKKQLKNHLQTTFAHLSKSVLVLEYPVREWTRSGMIDIMDNVRNPGVG